MRNFCRVTADAHSLNYDKFFKNGDAERNTLTEFNSPNTGFLNIENVEQNILAL